MPGTPRQLEKEISLETLYHGVSSMKRTVGIDLKETAIYIVQDGRITKVSPKQYGTDEIIWRDGRVIDVVRSHRERLNGQEVI